MKNRTRISLLVISLLAVLALAALYLIAFHCLGKDLKSLFDEGFFYLGLKSRESFTVFTQPLSLGNELLSAIWPDLGQRDILALRKLAYLSKLTGLLILSVSAFFFFRRERRSLSADSGLLLVSCIFLFGLYIIPSIVININDELVFLEMIVLALCFFALGTEKKWLKGVLSGLVGVFSFLAILCNAPGGIMLYLLSVLFICLYPGWRQSGAGWVIPASILGLMVGLGVMHFFVIRVPDFIAFLQTGIAQTSGGYAAAHHSLSRLLVSILLNIRNLIITVVSLLGITFVAVWIKRFTKKDWPAILVGLILFAIYFKWQVKPSV